MISPRIASSKRARLIYDWNVQCFEAPSKPLPDDLIETLLDDISTPNAVAVLHSLSKEVRKGQLAPALAESAGRLRSALELLGLYHDGPSVELLAQDVRDRGLDAHVGSEIERRLAFIRDRNWAEADRIRDELLEQGIQLKDGKDPVTGERVTTWEVRR